MSQLCRNCGCPRIVHAGGQCAHCEAFHHRPCPGFAYQLEDTIIGISVDFLLVFLALALFAGVCLGLAAGPLGRGDPAGVSWLVGAVSSILGLYWLSGRIW